MRIRTVGNNAIFTDENIKIWEKKVTEDDRQKTTNSKTD
jgi:hypothetical protein